MCCKINPKYSFDFFLFLLTQLNERRYHFGVGVEGGDPQRSPPPDVLYPQVGAQRGQPPHGRGAAVVGRHVRRGAAAGSPGVDQGAAVHEEGDGALVALENNKFLLVCGKNKCVR